MSCTVLWFWKGWPGMWGLEVAWVTRVKSADEPGPPNRWFRITSFSWQLPWFNSFWIRFLQSDSRVLPNPSVRLSLQAWCLFWTWCKAVSHRELHSMNCITCISNTCLQNWPDWILDSSARYCFPECSNVLPLASFFIMNSFALSRDIFDKLIFSPFASGTLQSPRLKWKWLQIWINQSVF